MVKLIKPDRGQAIVEFAFILLLLALLIVGIIDLSILFYDKAVITNASREGARQGSIFRSNASTGAYAPLDSTGVSNAVNAYLTGRLVSFGAASPNTAVQWSTTSPPGSWTTTINTSPGGSINVVVTYSYRFLALPGFTGWGNPLNISAQTIMRME
jgi:Flp pilus assembly protein TadG